jgi:hypothetical protein
MTMIAVGQGLRGLANRGMAAVARSESIENQQRMALEAQKTAAEAQTMGTGAGIGGMVGAGKVAQAGKTATEAVGALNTSIQGAGTVGIQGGGLTFTPAAVGAETLTGEAAGSALGKIASTADAAAALNASTTAAGTTAAGTTAAGTTAAGTTAASTTAASTTTVAGEVAAANAAAGSTGTMATLSTLAAPIAIGLGVAFLLNKLFD